ncbi:MAG: class I SAM-dependent methyltransferase [Solirubrobacteraceae bacterium]
MTTDIETLERLVQPAGKDVVDIGCGSGALARELTARGARVVGVEVSESQLAAALDQDDGRGARYVVGEAQHLPLADASADVAVFMRTLHHVPQPSMLDALREARRVVRTDGLVYAAEPLTKGDFFELVSLVEDELDVRRAAQDALAGATAAGLERATTIDYDVQVCVGDLAMLRRRIVSVDPQRAATFDARHAKLADAFARLGEPGNHEGERCFVQPMRADVLRRARADESM